MMSFSILTFLIGLAATGPASSAAGIATPQAVVLVTGATGRTGVLLYKLLKAKGVNVRGLVRNTTKARFVLGCDKCDASEGIFVGDITKKESLVSAMKGATGLAIVTSAIPICEGPGLDPSKCSYPTGEFPVDIEFHGGKMQIEAFAEASQGILGPVVLCSSMGSTNPEGFLEKLGNGHIGFFKLNEEAFLMSSGLPFTIVKPCGLVDSPEEESELLVGHDDDLQVQPPTIARADVARVMAEALLKPQEAAGLRFDLCSRVGTPTTDISKVFRAAKYPWQHAVSAETVV